MQKSEFRMQKFGSEFCVLRSAFSRQHLIACGLALLAAGPVAAQDKPNFAGEWILVSVSDAASGATQEMTVSESEGPTGSPFRIFKIERQSNGTVQSESYTIGITGGMVGGLVGGNTTSPSARSENHHSASWKGNTLVIARGFSAGPDYFSEHEEIWSLDTQDNLLLTVTDRASGAEPKTTHLVYRRR